MNYKEVSSFPSACIDCKEPDCGSCDTAGERWQLSRADELRLMRKSLLQSIERANEKIYKIDLELERIERDAGN